MDTRATRLEQMNRWLAPAERWAQVMGRWALIVLVGVMTFASIPGATAEQGGIPDRVQALEKEWYPKAIQGLADGILEAEACEICD